MVKEKKPDIVLTDIRMPSMSGLEFIKHAKKINSFIQFIIITGHSDFDYAKKAISLDVHEYLLNL